MSYVHRGDLVVVIAGKEKGKRGKVLRVLHKKDRVVVERVNMVKRHTKPSQKTPQGGIIEKEGSVHISNVSLWSEKQKKAIKVKIVVNEAGKKIRVCKKTGEVVPEPTM
ncbi:MAG TPA: 50S ribosomal protein L24 [Haliangiales bacterium]|nr:50S ribosomal protein L24 [Haliangiales bacterium]